MAFFSVATKLYLLKFQVTVFIILVMCTGLLCFTLFTPTVTYYALPSYNAFGHLSSAVSALFACDVQYTVASRFTWLLICALFLRLCDYGVSLLGQCLSFPP